ncbi:MAG: hypothetical protein NZ602_11210 [Thermoguttaceae bacterium]|nr:hypothetical protein [Thermoguttaceae bacterium]MDW8037880.1 hypothetical protein [Thermoguttaceae bacterium]
MPPLVCRLLIDPPAPGAWNMAVDETLLNWAQQTGGVAFRVYQWAEPTLTIGYFQRWLDRWQHPASLACPVVRRATGGGAIVHDRELTYCIVLPPHLIPKEGSLSLYKIIHESLTEVFHSLGVLARLWACGCQASGPRQEPFLCFQRRSRWDVVAAGCDGTEVKLLGSAQRRTPTGLLQHGSILLAQSHSAPELPGLQELLGRWVSPEELSEIWLLRLEEKLGWHWKTDSLTPQELEKVKLLVQTKYGAQSWTERR